MRRVVAPLASIATAVSLCACGSSSNRERDSTTEAGSPALATPSAVVAAAAKAIAGVPGYRLHGSKVDAHGTTTFDAVIAADGDVAATIGGASRIGLRRVGGRSYLNADAAYWRTAAGDRASVRNAAARYAGHWVVVPGRVTAVLADELTPSGVARCLTRRTSPLTFAGTATIDGRTARVVRVRGGRPGTAPGAFYVAARGAPLPLRVVTTGPRQPGGHVDPACDTKASSVRRADYRFSDFGAQSVGAPTDAIVLGQAGDRAPTGSATAR